MEPRKTKKGDLENKMAIFFEIGLILALAVVYLAFNTKSYQKQSTQILPQQTQLTIQEHAPITVQKTKTPPPLSVSQINLVPNDTHVTGKIDINVIADQGTPVPDYTPSSEEPDVPDQVIFKVVEHMPSFPGGEEALMKYLSAHIHYPAMAKEVGIQGTVYINFVVEPDGSIDRVNIIRGIGGGCDKEAMRVVKSMPKWDPGKQRGKPVRVSFNIPVRFALQ